MNYKLESEVLAGGLTTQTIPHQKTFIIVLLKNCFHDFFFLHMKATDSFKTEKLKVSGNSSDGGCMC